MLVSLEVPSGYVHAARRGLSVGLAHLFLAVLSFGSSDSSRPSREAAGVPARLGCALNSTLAGARGARQSLAEKLGDTRAGCVRQPRALPLVSLPARRPPKRRASSWADCHRRAGGPPPRLWAWLPFLSVVFPEEVSDARGGSPSRRETPLVGECVALEMAIASVPSGFEGRHVEIETRRDALLEEPDNMSLEADKALVGAW